jgi:hypothetical protein
MTMPPMEVLSELTLTDDLKQRINNAYANGTPIIIGYVNEDRQPSMSFRGSTQVYSDTQLAVWARNPDGGLVKAMDTNPNVTLLYRDPNPAGGPSRSIITFRGRGRVDRSDAVRRTVYDNSPEPERAADKEQRGVAVIIDLDSVSGFIPGYRLQMRR